MKRTSFLTLPVLVLVALFLAVPAVTQDRSGRHRDKSADKPKLSDWEQKMFCPYQSQVEAINRIRHLGMKNEKYAPATDMLIQFSKKSDNPAIKRMALFHASQLQEKAGHSMRAAEILIDVAKIKGSPNMGQGRRFHHGRRMRGQDGAQCPKQDGTCPRMKSRKGREGRDGRKSRQHKPRDGQSCPRDNTKPAGAFRTDRPMPIFECIAAEVL